MFTLENFTGLVVPNTGPNDSIITPDQLSDRVSLVESKFSYLFGGSSSFEGVGSYIGIGQGLIKEGIVLVLAWCTKEAYNDHYTDQILPWASYLARWWCQETIGVIDTRFQFNLISEEDYILRCNNALIPPPDYLQLLPSVPNDQALEYYRNGYTLAAAIYEEGTKEGRQ